MRIRARVQRRSAFPRLGAALSGIALVAASFVAIAPADAASVAAVSAESALTASQPKAAYAAGDYVVLVKGDPAARYAGGVAGYRATTPKPGAQLDAHASAVKSYTSYLGQRQQAIAKTVGAKIIDSYRLTLNGFAAHLSAAQATELAHRSDVLGVEKAQLRHPQADPVAPVPSYQYLGLPSQAGSGVEGVWDAVGGVANAGKGIVIGDIDTGISPENPSFAGDALGTADGDAPYKTGTDTLGQETTAFHKADGGTFTGICQSTNILGGDDFFEGYSWNDADCNSKIISARLYDNGFSIAQMGGAGLEYISPRDGIGHGSHTASTAAGDYGVAASVDTDGDSATPAKDYGTISGIAPAAKIAVYKVCWAGWNPYDESDDGCSDVDILAAIEQAVADGVDVINYSIAGGSADTTVSLDDLAFLDAAEAGVFVAAGAGNSGPTASSVSSASPWVTTVAASTMPGYEATAVVGSGASAQKFVGASVTVPDGGISGTLVSGADAAAAVWPQAHLPLDDHWPGDPVDPKLAAGCYLDSLDPAKVVGKIVLCERGTVAQSTMAQTVHDAGAIGMIVVNTTPDTTDPDSYPVPTIEIDSDAHDALVALAHSQPSVQLVPGNLVGSSPATPQVASYSSRGPVDADGGDLLKPDVTAPGSGILADGPSSIDQWHLDHQGDPDGQPAVFTPQWIFATGTSMATPHVAGLAALYLGVHPDASPAEVKSAIMTSATPTLDSHGDPSTDVFAEGAGEVHPAGMLTPGMVYDDGQADWEGYVNSVRGEVFPGIAPVAGPDLNLPSVALGGFTASRTVKRTVTSTQAGDFTPHVTLPGFTVDLTVDGQSDDVLHFTAAGQSKTFSLTFEYAGAPADSYAEGSLDWVGSGDASGITVHSPLAVRPSGVSAPALVTGSGTAGSAALSATMLYAGTAKPTVSGLVRGEHFIDGTALVAGHTGHGVSNADTSDLSDAHTYYLAVPEGTKELRIELEASDPSVDFDLYALPLDGQGYALDDLSSTNISSHQTLDISDPLPGSYELDVDPYTGSSDFDVYAFAHGVDETGSLAVTPGTIAGGHGDAANATASWHGLEAHSSYEGIVDYGGEALTFLRVETGDPLPLSSTTAPSVVGAPITGSTVVADAGAWSAPDTRYSYRWLIDGQPVKGATGSSFALSAAELGTQLAVAVTATADGYTTATASSASVTVVAPTPPSSPPPAAVANSAKPKITGTASRGHTLTASAGTWNPSTVVLSYQWLAAGKPIAGATKHTLKLSSPSLEGKKISVRVTAAKADYVSASADSATVTVKRTATAKIVTAQRTVHGIRHLIVTVGVHTSGGSKPAGKVVVSAGGKRRTVTLVHGVAKADFTKVPRGQLKITASYAGSSTVTAAKASAKARVK